MSQDESKFDTMRLIAGAEASDLYSLEDIVREFTDSGAQPEETEQPEQPEQPEQNEPATDAPEQEAASSEDEPKNAASEAEETPDASEEKEAQAQEDELPIDQNQQPPAYENLSESQMADAIAQAVAHSIEVDTAAPVIVQAEQLPKEQEKPAESAAQPKTEAPAPQAGPVSQPAAVQPPAQEPEPEKVLTAAAPSGEQETPAAQKKQTEAAKKPQKPKKAPAADQKPGTGHTKIKRSKVPSETTQYIAELLTEVRRRQAMALPKPGASLRGTEKRLATMTSIERMLSPVRYLILLLMLLCIGGRSVAWMSLGFMTGTNAITVSAIAAVLAMLLSWQSVIRGVRDLWYFRASYETFLLLVTILTIIDALVQKSERTFLPLTAIAWCITGMANQMHSQANLRSLRAVITGRNRTGIRTASGKWEHTDVIGKAPVTTSGFVRHQAQPDVWHNGMGIFLPILLVVSLVVSAYLSAKTGSNYLSVLVTILNVGMPVSLALCCARPYNLLSQALKGKGVVAGWFGMKELSGKKAMLIYDSDLFPEGTMRQMGVRAYGAVDPRALVSYGASMALRANVGFRAVFTKLLRDMNGEIHDVVRFQIQETGLEGYIQGSLVHLGSYQYMQLMGVTLPKRATRYGVYIAIDRQLAGLFGVKYQVSKGAKSGFRRLVREVKLTPLLVNRNFCINPGFVAHWFGVPVTQMTCPKAETRRMLSEPSLLTRGLTCGFVLREGVASYSRTVAGARRVYRMGLWLTLAAVLLGAVLTVQTMVAIAGGGAIITAQRLVILHFILYLVVEVWTRIALRA